MFVIILGKDRGVIMNQNNNNNQNLNPNIGQNMGQNPNFSTGMNPVGANVTPPAQNVQENLTKTQVLNLNDVEKSVKNNKDNKKTVMIIAFVGVFAIIAGLISQFVFSGSSEEDNKPKQNNNVADKNDGKSQKNSTLVCSLEQIGNADGTDTTTSLSFVFNEGKLQNYSKTLAVNPTAGNENGALSVQYLFTNYKQYETIPINGYTIITEQNGTGIQSSVNIDLTVLDKNTLTDAHIQNGFTNVEFNLDEEKEMIKDNLVGLGYSCQ